MTQQQYTPVSWQDETTSQQGTLINAERLNQMQTAHHYADGLEETDTVPTADPGVAYHKIVYCTADNTLYRWDGEAWTADIDDPTRELLEEHEADHDNPHQVTKAQVGLGNCDNTSDADKPISTATQTALDTKLTQRFTTAVGREYVYAYTRTQQTAIEASQGMETLTIPIRDSEGAMHAQVPASPQATHVINYGWANTELDKKADKATTYTKSEMDTLLGAKADKATTLAGYGITDAYTKTEADTLLGAKADQATTYTKTEVQTYVSNALDGYLPMVRTTGNQDIYGAKTFYSDKLTLIHKSAGYSHMYIGSTGLSNGYITRKYNPNNISVYDELMDVGSSYSTATSNYIHTRAYPPRATLGDTDEVQPFIQIGEVVSRDNTGFIDVDFKKSDGTTVNARLLTYTGSAWYMTAPTRGYNAGSAYASDVATIGTLDAYTPMVRTTGNQTIAGVKTFTAGRTVIQDGTTEMIYRVDTTHGTERYAVIELSNPNNNYNACLQFANMPDGTCKLQFYRYNKSTGTAEVRDIVTI